VALIQSEAPNITTSNRARRCSPDRIVEHYTKAAMTAPLPLSEASTR